MACPTVKRAGKVCAHCGTRYRPMQRYATSRYCSRACSHAGRSRLSRVLAGRKGGRQRAQGLRASASNRRQAAYRRGYADGYERALRDTALAQVAA